MSRLEAFDAKASDKFAALIYKLGRGREVVTADGCQGIVVDSNFSTGEVFINLTGTPDIEVYPGRFVASPGGGGMPELKEHVGKPVESIKILNKQR